MRCNVCGRELKPGQMFCQCGNTVGNDAGGQLNVNAPSSNKMMLFGALGGLALFIVLGIIIFSVITGSSSAIKDRTKWEHITGNGFEMTVPSGLKEGNAFTPTPNYTVVKALRSNEIAIEVSSVTYQSLGVSGVSRKKLEEIVRANLGSIEVTDGGSAEPKEHGNMIYYEYTQEGNGPFFGSGKAHIIDGMFVGTSAIYEVCIACPESKYAEYEESIFAWYDSFRGE